MTHVDETVRELAPESHEDLDGAETVLPSAADVRTLLNGLLPARVSVREEPAAVLPGRGVQVVGTYIGPDGGLRALVLLDLVLGCSLGAALTASPASEVEDARTDGRVPQALVDGTHEVLVVVASLFSDPAGPLSLRDVQVAPTPVTDDVVDLLRASPYRADMTVEVPGYGTGVLVLLRAGTEQ